MLGILAIPVNCKGQILPREGEFFQNFLVKNQIPIFSHGHHGHMESCIKRMKLISRIFLSYFAKGHTDLLMAGHFGFIYMTNAHCRGKSGKWTQEDREALCLPQNDTCDEPACKKAKASM